MKVNVEVSCTPEEARAFFGLPDIKPMQDRIMAEIEESGRPAFITRHNRVIAFIVPIAAGEVESHVLAEMARKYAPKEEDQ